MKNIVEIAMDIISYIFSIRIFDLPLHIFYVAIAGVVGYCTSMILIGVPCSIYEAITKKEVDDEKQNKIIRIVAICLGVALFLRLIYEKI